MNAITQVLTDGHGLEPLDEIWRQVSNQSPRLDRSCGRPNAACWKRC
jgi:hypothetical protein